MAQQINDNFSLLAGIPLDDRNAKTTIGLRDAIPATLRFEGLLCYVSQTSTLYQLQGGIENSNWIGIAGNNVTSDFETEIEGFLALSAGKTTLNAWEVGDKFRGWIGNRYVVGSIVSLPVSLPSDIDDPAKVSLEVDSNETSGFELLSNKATDFTTVNNTLYPSVQAVKTYTDGLDSGNVKLTGIQSIDGEKTFLEPIKIGNGTLSNPSISFFDELSGDTGFNHDTDGTIDVVSNGTLTQKFEVDKTTTFVPFITKDNIQVLTVGGVGKIEIDGDQFLHRKYSLQNVITGIANAGFEIRDETGGFTPMYIMDDGKVTFNFATFAPTAASGTTGNQIATLDFVNAAIQPYKIYRALISQSGTSAPTAVVLENTLGGTVTWSRTGAGWYAGNLSTAFTNNKTICFSTVGAGTAPSAGNQITTQISRLDDNNVQLYYATGLGGMVDSFSNVQIEIIVYP